MPAKAFLLFCGVMFTMLLYAEASDLPRSTVLSINTEEFPPLSFTEGDQIKGSVTEQVELMLQRANIPYELHVFPWVRAYTLARVRSGTCVYTTTHSRDRSSLFKWVEPLYWNRSILIKLKERHLDIENLEEAKIYRIGVQNEDVAKDFLTQEGFNSLDSAVDIETSILKLKARRVDMVALAESVYRSISKTDNTLKRVMNISETKMGLACNKAVPDALIQSMQKELDRLIADGSQAQIIKRYE